MNDKTLELFDAAYAGDIEKVKVCIDRGGDVIAINSCGDTPLIEAIASDNAKNRVAIVKLLIEHGADPDFKGEENCGVLFQAILNKDPEIMEILLHNGADPNFDLDGESLYERASFDYLYDAFNLKLPLKPTEQDAANEEAWLDFLDRCAEIAEVFKPEFLRVLLKYGAGVSDETQKV
ncbi:ankyrin repeat domain-containing protein [Thalassolituus sp. UBA2590]|uniref:ankyrin repeat domain-containing protein n=1 Tax=Thalassolituus sp. UBA2590 TaxID=1947663 RepID=UPI0026474269|nr:ankyrin repeat domain-containing protein [Thalassolituus sp. UBA2590]